MDKLASHFNNIPLKNKFLLILLTSFIIVCLSTSFILQIPSVEYTNQLNRSATQTISLFAGEIQSDLNDIENLSFRILADTVVQDCLSKMYALPSSDDDWIQAKSILNNRITNYSVEMGTISNLQLRTSDGTLVSHRLAQGKSSFSISASEIVSAREGKGKPVWKIENSTEGEPYSRIFLLRDIREVKNLTLNSLATVMIDVNLEHIVQNRLRAANKLGCDLVCAIYYNDMCLYSSNNAANSVTPGSDGQSMVNIEGTPYLLVEYTSQSGMHFVTLEDYSEIIRKRNMVNAASILLIISSCLTALIIAGWTISKILNHLKLLVSKFDDFAATGKPVTDEITPYTTRRDEIGVLHNHFDKMTRDMDEISRDREEKQRILQEKQMQQLRAQVRPHFLFNTLESIYCLAKQEGNEKIADMTDALGKMFRASLNDKRDIITLKEDLQVTNDYLRIQLIRFGDRLQVKYDIDESLLTHPIPSVTIQPLVENAIHHAAEEMMDTCVITLHAQITAEYGECVIVEDNGPGMAEDMLQKLKEGTIQPEGLGIGLNNINSRLKYAFGEKYGLVISSSPGSTRVIIKLPSSGIK